MDRLDKLYMIITHIPRIIFSTEKDISSRLYFTKFLHFSFIQIFYFIWNMIKYSNIIQTSQILIKRQSFGIKVKLFILIIVPICSMVVSIIKNRNDL